MSKINDVLIIVPVFNENKNIISVIKDLENWFENIIIIDDGSTDNTCELIDNLGLSYVRHFLNLGQGAAIETGLQYFLDKNEYKYAITFDGDGQHRAKDAFKPASQNFEEKK